jgi:hypothetical protein
MLMLLAGLGHALSPLLGGLFCDYWVILIGRVVDGMSSATLWIFYLVRACNFSPFPYLISTTVSWSKPQIVHGFFV